MWRVYIKSGVLRAYQSSISAPYRYLVLGDKAASVPLQRLELHIRKLIYSSRILWRNPASLFARQASQQIPFMITKRMKVQLREKGFTDEQISLMKPADAHMYLQEPESNSNSNSGAPQAAPQDKNEINSSLPVIQPQDQSKVKDRKDSS